MKLNRGLVVGGVFLVCALQSHHAHARGPSTPEERAKVIELTRMLERDPLNENADATRQWLRQWTIEVPEVRFHVCNERSRPDARSAFLDDLVAMRDRGELADHIALMTTTFFVLALALLTVALSLRNLYGPSRGARVGFGLLVVGSVFICIAGVFRGFPLHDVGSAVGLPSVIMAALLLSWSFRRAPGWRPLFLITLLIALGMFTALLSIVVDVGMPGLQQRIFLSLVLLWLVIVAHRLVRVTARPL
jgi:hypothetical membrane protein